MPLHSRARRELGELKATAVWIAWGVLLYSSTLLLFPHYRWAAPVLLGTTAGMLLPRQAAASSATGAYLIASLLGLFPPGSWSRPSYFEPHFQELLAQFDGRDLGQALGGLLLAWSAAWVSTLIPWNESRRWGVTLAVWLGLMLNQAMVDFSLGSPLLLELQKEPVAGSYDFDGVLWLKALHRYRQGDPYRDAVRIALEGDARGRWPSRPKPPPVPLPDYFWLLAQLPHPGWIPIAVWGFLLQVQLLVLLAQRQRGGDAALVLAASLLSAYWAYPASTLFCMTPDFWAGALVLASLAWGSVFGTSGLLGLLVAATWSRTALWFLVAAVGTSVAVQQRRQALSAAAALLLAVACHVEWSLSGRPQLPESVGPAWLAFRHGCIFLVGGPLVLGASIAVGAVELLRRRVDSWRACAWWGGVLCLIFTSSEWSSLAAPALLWCGADFLSERLGALQPDRIQGGEHPDDAAEGHQSDGAHPLARLERVAAQGGESVIEPVEAGEDAGQSDQQGEAKEDGPERASSAPPEPEMADPRIAE